MALIIDPDQLNQGTEVTIDTGALTIDLATGGNLSTDGVTLQALYSFLKEEWKTDANLIKFPFPMVAVTPEQFEFVNDWVPADQATSDLFRNAGYAIKNSNGTSAEEYIGCITLGTLGGSDQVYYQQEVGGSASDIVLTGAVNQCVQVYADGGGHGLNNAGAFDYRGYFKVFVREWGKTYGQSSHADIGVTTFTYQAYRFPLTNATDLKISAAEGTAAARSITLTYGAITRNPDGSGPYDFSVLIDAGSSYTAEEIYEFIQAQLRLDSDIDDGAGDVTGKTADAILGFVGDTLVTEDGVWIDNFQSIDTNRIEFYDDTGNKRTYPYVAAGVINFNDNLVNDSGAVYRMYYSDNYGSGSATLVEDSSNAAISGTVSGSEVTFDYDYDGDTAGGGAGIDKNVTVVAIGTDSAQFVIATGTITRSTANSFSLVAALERNYNNPA